jgi:uncharacterized protein
MLTKNLLRYKIEKQKIVPNLLDLEKKDIAQDVLSLFHSSYGKTVREIEDNCNLHSASGTPVFEGLKKLVEENCNYIENEDASSFTQKRWEIISQAQELRSKKNCSLKEFIENFEHETLLDYKQVSETLYQDLPCYKILQSCKEDCATSLLHRYNCAQIQGLLLKSIEINLTISGPAQEHRSLLKHMKFHRLLYSYKKQNSNILLSLSGPCEILQQKISYGLRVANFFPHILNLSKWNLQAQIRLAKGDFSLNLDENINIKSHYQKTQEYLPTEIIEFTTRFNSTQEKWKVQLAETMIDIGKQKFVFPDMIFTSSSGQRIYFEIFHRWHGNNIVEIINLIRNHQKDLILIGVCRSLGKNLLEQLCPTTHNIITFRDFPTVKGVYKSLDKLSDKTIEG